MIASSRERKPVLDLQNMLRTISHYTQSISNVVPDGIFGVSTQNSVLDFQKAYGLEQTGEVDNKTWDKIRDAYNNVITIYSPPQPGIIVADSIYIDREDELLELFVIQAMILALSRVYSNIPDVDVTGRHDDKSVVAVTTLQEIFSLEPTGVIDTITFNAISRLYSSGVAKRIDYPDL